MAIEVKLEAFEGPLDLLLHLIEKNKVDIYDIPIVTITDQYLEYVNAMQNEDLNVVSEFLVMAATLLDIKCKMLLPKEVDENDEEIDPRAELVEKLIEYKTYKYMSLELKDMQLYAGKSIYREAHIPKEVAKYEAPVDLDKLLSGIDMQKLQEVFDSVIKRREDKISYVRKYAGTKKKFSFRQLLEKSESKQEIIVTFLAVLELIKSGKIKVAQKHTFDDIIIDTI